MEKFPEIGVVFELRLNGDVLPLAMVEKYGYNLEGWKHNGPLVKGQPTRKFKLIPANGLWKNIGEMIGSDLEGQWMEAFRVKFPKSDGEHPVGVYDSSWIDPHGFASFPLLFKDGTPLFSGNHYVFHSDWLWIVEVK